MTNIEALRKIITEWSADGLHDIDEAEEFLDAIRDEIIDLKQDVKDVEQERDDVQKELDDEPELTSVFLGLDTLHYRLESGNLKVQLQLEHWINQVKTQNCAGVLL